MAQRRILAVYGHPDDEGQATGTLAQFLSAGDRVTLVCATRGEVGEISDTTLATPDTLGYVRELELRAAMAQIGLADVRLLPFRDSGMAGTPENEDPRSLHQQPADTVLQHLVAIVRDVRPHAIFTWDPEGGYGHPDHVAVHRHTLAALDTAADPSAYPEAGRPWQTPSLYWSAFGMKRFAGMFLEMERRGLLPADAMEPERKGRFLKAVAEPDAPATVVNDTRAHVDVKRRAAQMHRSQFGENSMFARLPEDLQQQFFGQERFYQARPTWPGGTPLNDFAHLPGD